MKMIDGALLDGPKESIAKGLVYAVALWLLYYASHKLMVRWWKMADYNYCYLIPVVVLYLIWEKRAMLAGMPSRETWTGMWPLCIGIFLFWLGELGGEYYTIYLSSWFVLLGLCWMHLGWRKLKIILFPIGFILTMFPPPNFIYFNLSLKLKLISSRLGVWILQMLDKSAYREGNVIDLGFTQLQVVDACNGMRYLFPLIVLSILVAHLYKSTWWKKALVVISAVPISIFVNGLRIASVGLFYPIWGQQVAEGFFHDFSGWAIFMVSSAILVAEMWLLNRVFREAPQHSGEDMGPAPVPGASGTVKTDGRRFRKHLLWQPRFIAAVSIIGLTAVIAQTVDFREEVPAAKDFTEFPMQVGRWKGNPETMQQSFRDGLKMSDYVMANYADGDGKSVNFYTAYYSSQRKAESIHSPSSCLPGGGWVLNQSGTVEVAIAPGGAERMRINRAFIQKGDARQLTYYWFPMRGRILTSMWEMKLFNFWDALTRHRTEGALVRLVTPVYANEPLQQAEVRLQAFLSDIVPILNQFLPQ